MTIGQLKAYVQKHWPNTATASILGAVRKYNRHQWVRVTAVLEHTLLFGELLLPCLNCRECVERGEAVNVALADLIEQRMFGGSEQRELQLTGLLSLSACSDLRLTVTI